MATVLRLEPVASGLVFGESPRWHEGHLWLVDTLANHVLRLESDGTLTSVADVPGKPGGLGFLPDGSLEVVAMRERRVLRVADAGLQEVADLAPHAPFPCNDLVVDAQGRRYVGTFGYDFWGGAPPRPTSLLLLNEHNCARPVGEGLIFPNGLVITPDGRTLIVAETFANRLSAFPIREDGWLGERRTWADLGDLYPDGICLDAEGAIWAGCSIKEQFVRVREGGEVTHVVPTLGRWAVACALGGADRRTLYCLTAATTMELQPRGIAEGFIEAVRVDLPGAGRP